MKKKGFALPLVILGITFLLGLGSVIYFTSTDKPDQEVAKLSTELESAQARLDAERAKLADMEEKVRAAYPRHSAIRLGYNRMRELIKRTDTLFNLAGGELVLKLKGSSQLVSGINTKRKKIGEFLENWRKSAAISFTTAITPSVMQQIIADAQAIGLYTDDLETLINELTSGSDLSQSEIDALRDLVSGANSEADSVVSSLVNSSSTTPTTPPPTLSELEAQAALVEELARLVAEIQRRIDEILAANPYLPPGYVGTSNPNEPLFYDPIRPRDGRPQLIEGTNQD